MLFKNQYVETKEMNRKKCGVSETGTAIGLMYLLFAFFSWNNGNTGMVILWISIALIWWAEAGNTLKKWEAAYDKNPNKDPHMLLEFYEDKLIVTKNDEIKEITYLQIDDIEECADFYILHFNIEEPDSGKFTVRFISQKELEESRLIVSKSGFEIGDAKEFKKFIKEKKQKGFIIH